MLPFMPLAAPVRMTRGQARVHTADFGSIVMFGVVSGLAGATLIVLATILRAL